MTRSIPEAVRAKTVKLATENPHAARRYLGEALGLKKSQRNDMFKRVIGEAPAPKVSEVTAKPRKIRRLFLDIESSPNTVLTWRIGYKINLDHSNLLNERAIICVCYKWSDESKVHYLHWDKNQSDKAMLVEVAKVLEQADEIIGHNLARFDLPWLKTRALFHGLPPLPDLKVVDTLQIARRKFYFNSNRLDYLGKFLGFGGKIKTEFGLWKEIVLNRCPKAMRKMVEYCQGDVLLLERVWKKLNHAAKPKSHAGVMSGGYKWSCPYDGGTNVVTNQRQVSAKGVLSWVMRCKDCGAHYTISDSVHEEYLVEKPALARAKEVKSLSWRQ